ncbi:unnamed protein product [Phaeothamnion confervicola]
MCLPHAPAALLKATVIVAGLVEHPATGGGGGETLARQLERSLGGGGMQILSRSNLPTGSGMGGSSILAGVVLSAISSAAGRPMDKRSLVHAVLLVEQLLTSGGGWQDQAGGLVGGLKLITSAPGLPLEVATRRLDPPLGFAGLLSERLVLVFSGRQRLARDLLQARFFPRWHRWHLAFFGLQSAIVAGAFSPSGAAAAKRPLLVGFGRLLWVGCFGGAGRAALWPGWSLNAAFFCSLCVGLRFCLCLAFCFGSVPPAAKTCALVWAEKLGRMALQPLLVAFSL